MASRLLRSSAIGLVVLLALVGCSSATPTSASAAPENVVTATVPVAKGTAASALAALPVKGRAPKTGYSRDQFGQSWADVDHNGCDTRNDILIRDLQERQMDGRCKVLSGVLYPDPYTGQKIIFTKGQSKVDIDHAVALGDVWVKGGQQLTSDQRLHIANDPLNLLAVDYSANRQKGDADAATWLPSNKSFRCQYVARQIAVKQKYLLWVTQAEKDAMNKVLSTCPNEPLPTDKTAISASPAPGGTPVTPVTPMPKPSTQAGYYATCADAKAAGVTPLVKGDGVYEKNTHLDANHDGIACNN